MERSAKHQVATNRLDGTTNVSWRRIRFTRRSNDMGIFDFVRNAGAKVGLGKSTDEIAAEEQAEAAADAAEKRAEYQKRAAEMATKRNAAKEKIKTRAAQQRSAENAKRREQARKGTELEKYVRDMDLSVAKLDVRYDDGTVFVDGEAADAATKEKVILLLGNVEGVAQVDESLTVTQDDGSDSTVYVVESGDTLWAIATAAYGDGNRYPEIFEANKPMLSDPDKIYPGQALRIP